MINGTFIFSLFCIYLHNENCPTFRHRFDLNRPRPGASSWPRTPSTFVHSCLLDFGRRNYFDTSEAASRSVCACRYRSRASGSNKRKETAEKGGSKWYTRGRRGGKIEKYTPRALFRGLAWRHWSDIPLSFILTHTRTNVRVRKSPLEFARQFFFATILTVAGKLKFAKMSKSWREI